MIKREIGNNILFYGDPVEVTNILAKDGIIKSELIVCDPDYKHITKNLDSTIYRDMRNILLDKHPLLHYTANSSGQCDSFYTKRHNLIQKLTDAGFRYNQELVWKKYNGQKLMPTKMSHRKTSVPKDLDFLIITIKNSYSLLKKLNLQELHNGSGLIIHEADQNNQFKPASLCHDIVKGLTVKGDRIFEPYMGSANLAVESIHLGRTYYGIESNKELFDKAVDRVISAHLTYNILN